jgi:DNA-3-methyladenine glycosylase II
MMLDQNSLEAATRALCRKEPRFKPIVKRHGVPSLRAADPGFEGLLQIVVEQFLSLKAADVIWKRIVGNLGDMTPHHVASVPLEDYRAWGLSNTKGKSFIGIATAVRDQRIDLGGMTSRSDEDVFKDLTRLPGIGPWSAEIFLLANLARPDVFPAGDLALQEAARDLLGLRARPDPKKLLKHAENWRPWRAVAARLLWSHYRYLKQMPQA